MFTLITSIYHCIEILKYNRIWKINEKTQDCKERSKFFLFTDDIIIAKEHSKESTKKRKCVKQVTKWKFNIQNSTVSLYFNNEQMKIDFKKLVASKTINNLQMNLTKCLKFANRKLKKHCSETLKKN